MQFVSNSYVCINYLNFTQPKVFRIPYEMIKAYVRKWLGYLVDLRQKVIICLAYELGIKIYLIW